MDREIAPTTSPGQHLRQLHRAGDRPEIRAARPGRDRVFRGLMIVAIWLMIVAIWLATVVLGAYVFEARGAEPPLPSPAKPSLQDEQAAEAAVEDVRRRMSVCIPPGGPKPYREVADMLFQKFQERRIQAAYLSGEVIAELWLNAVTGSYTIVARTLDDYACASAIGELPWLPVRQVAL